MTLEVTPEERPPVRRRVALDANTLRRAGLASLVVGTVLTALNQGDVLIAGGAPSEALWWKIPLTYLVPFVVTIYGASGRGER